MDPYGPRRAGEGRGGINAAPCIAWGIDTLIVWLEEKAEEMYM